MESDALKEDFRRLKQESIRTMEQWNDDVRTRFYGDFIDELPKDFNRFASTLANLEKVFIDSERKIKNLLE